MNLSTQETKCPATVVLRMMHASTISKDQTTRVPIPYTKHDIITQFPT
jgi:hypothetical protein